MSTIVPSVSPPGIIADRYRVIEELGSGGMATVYLAAMDGPGGFGKLVAIKRIHPHLATKERFVQMFLDEARIISRIDHPNVCTVLDFGQTQDTYFLAMEYIMGETLLDTLRRLARQRELLGTPRWNAFSAYLIAEACEGLHDAHELCDEFGKPLNIVHRDVSPDNIFLSYQGEIKVMDFGIARAEGRLHQTATGVVKGKVRYMAPESLNGEENIDRRVDIWALGVCLWELLTGKALFKRTTDMATIAAIALEEPPCPSTYAPTLPAKLEAITMAALQREFEHRTATARDMGRALRQYLASSDVTMDRVAFAEMVGELHAESKAEKLAQRAQLRQSQHDIARSYEEEAAARRVRRRALSHAATAEAQPNALVLAAARPSEHMPSVSPDAPEVSNAPETSSHAGTSAARGEKRRLWPVLLAGLLLLGGAGVGFAVATMGGDDDDDAGPDDTTLASVSTVDGEESAGPGEAVLAPIVIEPGAPGTAASTTDERADATDDHDAQTEDSTEDSTEDAAARARDGKSSRSRRRARRDAARADRDTDADDDDDAAETKRTNQTGAPGTGVIVAGSSATVVEPVVEPIIKPIIEPPEPVEVPPPPARPTSFKAKTAITSLRARGPLSTAKVKPAVERKRDEFARCYEKVARKAGRNAATSVAVEFRIDESRRARKVAAKGGSLPGLDDCVADVVQGVRSQEAPDIGDARISFTVSYKPSGN